MKNRINQLRKESGITAVELAHRIGVAERTMRYYEDGRRDPNTETLNKLAEIFDCTIDYLLYRTDTKKELIINDNEFLLLAEDIKKSGLTPSDIRDLMKTIQQLKGKHL